MAGAASDAIQQLMRDNRVPTPVQTYLVTTLKVDTLARAHNAFDEPHLTDQINLVLTACGYRPRGDAAEVTTSRVIASDVKQFWREACAENSIAITRKAGRVDEVTVGPLPSLAAAQLLTSWKGRHDFEMLPAWKLAPNQLGKLAREFEKAALTLWLVHRVKTVPMARHDKAQTKVPLDRSGNSTAAVVISAEEAEPESLTLVSAYLDRAWIFLTNCAYVGIHPRLPDGTKIAVSPGVDPYCRWDVACHYHWHMKERATTPLPDGKLPTISQLRDADEKTRLHWMRLTGPDAPIRVTLTEAIKRSMQECHHIWTWPVSTEVVPTSEANGSPNANGKRQRGGGGGANLPNSTPPKTGRQHKGNAICKKHHDERTCKNPCPERKMHVCDVLVGDNQTCGKAHKRANCPHVAASHQYRND